MALKKPQTERLEYLIHGRWADDWMDGKETRATALKKYRRTVAEMESAEEIHQFSFNYNWDDGAERLDWLLAHPACDQGTALLLFWLGEPAFHFRYQKRSEVDDWAKPTWAFLQKLCKRYLNGEFKSAAIKTDPTDILGNNCLRSPKTDEGQGLYRIPYGMCVPSPGRKMKRLSLS